LWINDEEKKQIYTFDSWNDEIREQSKSWIINKAGGEKLIKHLKVETTLFDEFNSVISYVDELGMEIKGNGIDVGAGSCWCTALLSKIKLVKRLHAIDFSYQRLKNVAPGVLELFNAKKEKINLVMGNFYDLKLDNNSIDFCFLCSTFHHADEPEKLLREIKRVLKPNGIVMMIGERPVFFYDHFIKYIKNLIKILLPSKFYKGYVIYNIIPSFKKLYPTDEDEGDHYYRLKDYKYIFKCSGFQLLQKRVKDYDIFIAKAE